MVKTVKKSNNKPLGCNDAEESCRIFISSRGIETVPVSHINTEGKRVTEHYVLGSINGEPFQVICNKQVDVSPAIAEALSGLIQKQSQRL